MDDPEREQANEPSVLVPCFHLCVGEIETCGELHAVLDAQILLTFEALLQAVQLLIGERRARFAWFLVGFQC